MDEVRALVGGGLMHGGGTDENVFRMGLDLDPHFIASDAGSTDPGPAFLGSGKPMTQRPGLKQSFDVILRGSTEKNIPLILGSAGMGGGWPHVQLFAEIAQEVAKERGLHFRMALINSEIDKEYLKQKLREGKTNPLGPVPPLTEENIDRSARIVGMMGLEPIQEALNQGAQVIITGRSSDSALFAALPIMWGIDPGVAWHAAKTIECGALCTEDVPGVSTSVMARMRSDHFIIEPTNPEGMCSATSVSAHTLYENPSPFESIEPGYTIDSSACGYEFMPPNRVKVGGTRYQRTPYTVRLEGAEMVGYRTINIGATRDPILVAQLDRYLDDVKEAAQQSAENIGIPRDNYHLFFRVYGQNGVMQTWDPSSVNGEVPQEACVIAECIAPTQEMASSVMAFVHICLFFSDFEGRLSTAGNWAFPYSPHDIELGPMYRFNILHVVEPADPMELFPIEMVDV